MTVLPFYFHWVDQTETIFDADTMNVFDEEIFSFKLTHEEGQIPTLDITLRNPRVGLLNPSRKRDVWLAWQSPADDPDYHGAIIPLFFGRLVGIPSNLFKELVALQFIARSPTFIADKQAVAETMKVQPFYDPFFLDDKQRDDPDSILEGWSSLWHTDRLTRATSASDILVGEDGTVTFDEDNAFYDSVGMTIGQAPLVNVRVEAAVNWTQRTGGFFTVPTVHIASYTGDSFFGDWPRAGSGLGGGYTVESSFVTDVYHVSQTPTTSYQSTWENTDPNPGQCSNAAASSSSSGPALLSPDPLSCVLTEYVKTGLCFPDSDPPQNTPGTTSVTGMIVPLWYISGDMTVRYDAQRSYSELLSFDMVSNVQPILSDPTVDQDTELLTISSVDLGKPMFDVKNWTDFAGESVPIAQIIWPNNPTTPGGLAYQVCVQPGIAGATEPVFSDIPGEETTDGSVIWASIGDQGLSDIPQWQGGMGVPAGMIVLITAERFNPATGNLETVPNTGSYYLCLRPGQTNPKFTIKTYVPPVQDNTTATPIPRTVSIMPQPMYITSPGTLINDGTVQWIVLGVDPPALRIPIGGTATNVQANNYFPTERGLRSVEYLIMRARARLRFRSRAVDVEWDTFFRNCVALSCRKNASLIEPRLPGGQATGKITGYTMECEGGSGRLRGHVKIGVSVGLANDVVANPGTPSYANEGYVNKGYQRYTGATTLITDANDVTYTPPKFASFDDGLRFPLTWDNVSDGGKFSNTLAAQKAAIEASFAVAQELVYIQAWASTTIAAGNSTSTSSGLTPGEAWKLEEQQLALASGNTPYVMEANPISWTALLKPCTGSGPFTGAYNLVISPLECPKGIDLSANSNA